MVKNLLAKLQDFGWTLMLLPLVGCTGGGGGGTSAVVGSLFGPSSVGSLPPSSVETMLASASTTDALSISASTAIATMHNPEPATMFLLGSGLVAFGCVQFKRRQR